jgi:hypothetical protein
MEKMLTLGSDVSGRQPCQEVQECAIDDSRFFFGAKHLSKAACAQDDDLFAVKDDVELAENTAATAWSLTGEPSGLCNLHNRK